MEIERLPLGQSHADKCRAANLKWRNMPPGIPPDMAVEFVDKLKAGSTIRKLTSGVKKIGPAIVSYERFKKHCELHPEWAAGAWAISQANTAKGKGDALRVTTHCRAGLHAMTGENVFIDGTHGRRRCLACRRASTARLPMIAIEVVEKVKLALTRGASISQITQGKPVGGGKRNSRLVITSPKALKRYRIENPDFNRFVMEAMSDSLIVGQRLRHQRRANAAKREETNDYFRIRALVPIGNPHRDDIISRIFEDLLSGSLKREDIGIRIKVYVTELNRLFPTKHVKFGNSPLVSLDEVMFEDGSTTGGDTVSRGLWD
jgi:hypothetical protein